MSWLFSQALVEEFSAGTSLAGLPCAQLNVMPTPHKFSRNGKPMEFSSLSRFGLTCELLTARHGEELLMSFLVASRARTYLRQENLQESKANDQGYGEKWRESLAKYDQDMFLWRIPQTSLLEDSVSSLEIWPSSGMTVNGIAYQRHSTVPRISAIGLGLLPTPTVSQGRNKTSGRSNPESYHHNGTTMMDWLWLNIGQVKLKTSFVEWAMMLPQGWTDLKPLAMDKFHEWQQQHSL